MTASTLDFVSNFANNNHAVIAVEEAGEVLRIRRKDDLPALLVLPSDEKWLETASFQRYSSANPSINGIVVSGRDVHYTGEARRLAGSSGVGLHTLSEFASALGSRRFELFEDKTALWIKENLPGHSRVVNLTQTCERVFKVTRDGLPSITFTFDTKYILGTAEAAKHLRHHPKIDAIVNWVSHNQYTEDARTYARTAGVAILNGREFWRALHKSGTEFLDYRLS